MKKKIIILSSILFLVILCAIGYFVFYYQSDALKFSKEYNSVTEDNVFVYRDASEIIKILEKGTGIVYLGFPECPWCNAYVSILNEVAKEEEIDKIYYYNILEDRKNNTNNYKKIVSILKEHLNLDEEGNERIYVPDVTFVLEGKIIGHNNETSLISSLVTPKEYWTEEKIVNLKNTLRNYITEINLGICSSCDA